MNGTIDHSRTLDAPCFAPFNEEFYKINVQRGPIISRTISRKVLLLTCIRGRRYGRRLCSFMFSGEAREPMLRNIKKVGRRRKNVRN